MTRYSSEMLSEALCDMPHIRPLSLLRGGVAGAGQLVLDKEQQKLKMQEEAAAIKAQMDEELRLMEEELEEQVLPRQLWGVSVGRG